MNTLTTASIDAGLRGHMLKVYNWMTLGLLATAGVAWGMFVSGLAAALVANSVLSLVVALSPLAVLVLMWVLPQTPTSQGFAFLLLASLFGASTSTIFLAYTTGSIFTTFLATAAGFAGLSLFGYTTKMNMSGLGTFFLVALFGLLAVMILNIFIASTVLGLAISILGVLLFAGLTAYDTQKIKDEYIGGYGNSTTAIRGALTLYLDFLNMFLFLLRLFGVAKSD